MLNRIGAENEKQLQESLLLYQNMVNTISEKDKEIERLAKEVADLKRQLEKYETSRYDKDDFDGKRDPWDDLGKWANEHTF